MKKNHALPVLCLLLGLARPVQAAQPGGPPKDETFSENRKYSVEIGETEIDKPILAVFARDGDVPRLVWSRALRQAGELDDPNGFQFGGGQQLRKTVSDDGGIAILRPFYASNEQTAVRVLTQKGGDASFTAEDLTALLDDVVDEDYPQLFSSGSNFIELLLEEENPPRFALWIPAAARWLSIDLRKLEARLAGGADAARLDALGLEKARGIVRQGQGGGGLTRVLNSLRKKAAAIVPGMIDANPPQIDFDRLRTAYGFLAAQKQPEDRPAIEALLETPPGTVHVSTGLGERHFGAASGDRALGEELLAKWDGNPLDPLDDPSLRASFSRQKSRRFGAVYGTVHLPFKTPDDAGPVQLYLIPSGVPAGAFATDESVLKPQLGFNDVSFGPPGSRVPVRRDSIHFAFETLDPGEYRLKAVWKRHAAPRRPAQPTEPGLTAGPGDYESAESGVFQVAAARLVTGVRIDCTNRVAGAEASYAADDAWAVGHPAAPEGEDDALPFGPRNFTSSTNLVSRPAADWLARTNENTGDIQISRIRLTESNNSRTGGKSRRLTIRFRAPAPKSKNDWHYYQGRLEDEHGCRFETGGANVTRRTHELHFPIVPYGSGEMKLVITLRNPEDDGNPARASQRKLLGASFLLRNLCGIAPADWQPEPLPARRQLDLATIELTAVNFAAPEYTAEALARFPAGFPPSYGRNGQAMARPENKYSVLQDGAPTAGWLKISGEYQDRWGNRSGQLGAFCAKEEIFKLSTEFAREPDRRLFLPAEMWEVPVSKVPGAGESLPLKTNRELQGLAIRLFSVGGGGEYVYDDGRLQSATNRLGDGGFGARFRGPGGAPQPKLELVETRPGLPRYSGAFRPPGPVTLASRIPHLACRIPATGGHPLVALLEEDTSVEEPMNAPPRQPNGAYYGGPKPASALKFLPLDFRAGETGRSLTFLVQQPRAAEFIFRLPRAGREQAE